MTKQLSAMAFILVLALATPVSAQSRAEIALKVERLERELQFINIALMPILVALFALVLSIIRARRRRRRIETADAGA